MHTGYWPQITFNKHSRKILATFEQSLLLANFQNFPNIISLLISDRIKQNPFFLLKLAQVLVLTFIQRQQKQSTKNI